MNYEPGKMWWYIGAHEGSHHYHCAEEYYRAAYDWIDAEQHNKSRFVTAPALSLYHLAAQHISYAALRLSGMSQDALDDIKLSNLRDYDLPFAVVESVPLPEAQPFAEAVADQFGQYHATFFAPLKTPYTMKVMQIYIDYYLAVRAHIESNFLGEK